MAKAMKKSLVKKTLNPPKRDGELYVTKRLLDLTKKELKSDIAQLRMEMKTGFTKVDGRFTKVEGKLSALSEEISSLRADMNASITSLRADMNASNSRLEAMFTKIVAISEEQNERNKVVLDSYGLVYDKLNNHDKRLKKVEKHVLGIEQD